MSGLNNSNLAVSFLNIHSIITRGLRISITRVQEVLQHGSQDEGRRDGFFNYIRALSSVLASHHLMENEIAFPYFRNKMPEAPFDSLLEQHQEMIEILDEIRLAAEKCEKDDQPEANATKLKSTLNRLNETWHVHIQVEEDEFISKADALISVEEQLRLVELFAEHGLKIAVPHYLTVPFMLYNLPLEKRAVFSQGMPAEVVENLVPIVWKEKWESMTPFLLI